MPTTAEHMAARSDNDLIARLIAQAEMMGVPTDWVMSNLVQLIQAPVTDEGATITSVHAYAAGARAEHIAATPPPPGLNPSAVLDSYLAAAILAVQNPATPE